ncbi:MAG: hypothetical protein WC443_13070 [Desulfobaccales bacterium]
MAYVAAKSRTTFKDFCDRIDRCGFWICFLNQYPAGGKPHLQVVVMNAANLALKIEGPLSPPHWGEDLFYKLLTQVELFGRS